MQSLNLKYVRLKMFNYPIRFINLSSIHPFSNTQFTVIFETVQLKFKSQLSTVVIQYVHPINVDLRCNETRKYTWHKLEMEFDFRIFALCASFNEQSIITRLLLLRFILQTLLLLTLNIDIYHQLVPTGFLGIFCLLFYRS